MTRLLAALAVIAMSWLVAAAVLMNIIGAIHAWWGFVPTMPYTVALQVAIIYVIAAFIGETLKAVAGRSS